MNDDGGEKVRQTRSREMTRITDRGARAFPSPFEAAVVGMSFTPGYPQTLHDLSAMQLEAEVLGEPLVAIVVREPDNPHDHNAVAVHVPALGEDGKIGHLPRPIAARLAVELDTDVRWSAQVSWVRVDPNHPDRPGISINLKRL